MKHQIDIIFCYSGMNNSSSYFVDLNGLGILRDERLSSNLSALVLTLSPRQRPLFIVGRAGERKKIKRAGDDGKGKQKNRDCAAY